VAVLAPEKVESPGVSPETITPIKPSEWIRLGSLTVEQSTGCLFSEGKACAIGAAWLANGGEPVSEANNADEPVYEWFNSFAGDAMFSCPIEHSYAAENYSLSVLAFHLNDVHQWSFHNIADTLESLGY
jgi:hypothetical protein